MSEDDRRLVADILPPNLTPLFFSMVLRDQQHALAVWRLLARSGVTDVTLLQSALLHDVGKGRPRMWQRIGFVLANAAAPSVAERAGRARLPGLGWFRQLMSQDANAAALIAAAGGSETLSRIVGGLPCNSDEEILILLLRAADDAC